MTSITEAAKEQELTNQTMSQVADEITAHFTEAMQMVDELKQCVEIHTASDTADGEIHAMLDASLRHQRRGCRILHRRAPHLRDLRGTYECLQGGTGKDFLPCPDT